MLGGGGVEAIVCNLCAERPCFYSRKAHMQHMPTCHSERNPVYKYIDGSGVCPVCRTRFSARAQ
eukprot:7219874-Karenia_brevis.AAC.1